MKKFYFLVLSLIISGMASAQMYNVTFEVDMNNEVVDAAGVFLAGSFQGWDATANPMNDMDGDGVYSTMVSVAAGTLEFKFINGSNWENVPGGCRVELTGNENRWIEVSSDAVYHVCYERCSACNMNTVYFQVDMSMVDPINTLSGVHVAANIQSWDPAATVLSDNNGDLVYELLYEYDTTAIAADNGNILFKYINGDVWEFAEAPSGDCVDDFGNRSHTVVDHDAVLDPFCFGACTTCVSPTDVTFKVDASQILPVDFIDVAGSFTGWGDGALVMTEGADNIWEITLPLQPGPVAYKFRKNGTGWEQPDCTGGGDRTYEVPPSDIPVEVGTVCFNQCIWPCTADPDPADITFKVNMMETAPSADGVWMISAFTDPAWQLGAVELTDSDGDLVYEATYTVSGPATFQYKFVNGDVSVPENEEGAGIGADGCGVDNGIGGFNREYTRSGVTEVLDPICYDMCEDCVVGVSELSAKIVRMYPNPSSDLAVLELSEFSTVTTTLNVFNSVGQVVYSSQINAGTSRLSVDVKDWSTGVYTVVLSNEFDQLSMKLMVD